MANQQLSTELIVEAITKGFRELQGDLQETGHAAERAGEGVAESGQGASSAGLKWTELKSAVGLAQEAFGKAQQAAQQAYDFLKEGAALEATEERFGRLADSIGTTSTALERDLGDAVRGMMSNAESMSLASDLMSLGLVKTHEQAVRLTRSASALNMDIGQLTQALANQTTARFDQLNVSVDGFDERLNALKGTMSDQEAFLMAFLDQTEAQIDKVGDSAETAAGKLQILENRAKDTGDALKRDFLTVMMPVIDGLLEAAEAQDTLQVAMARGLVTAKLSAEGQVTYIESLRDGTRVTMEQVEAMVAATDAVWERQAAEDELRRAMSEVKEEGYQSIQSQMEQNAAYEEYIRLLQAADEEIRAVAMSAAEIEEGRRTLTYEVMADVEQAKTDLEDLITDYSGKQIPIEVLPTLRGRGEGHAKGESVLGPAKDALSDMFGEAVLRLQPQVDYREITEMEAEMGNVIGNVDYINTTDLVPPVDQTPVEDLLTEIGKSQTAIDEFVRPTYRLETESNLDELNTELNTALGLIRAIEGTHYFSIQQSGNPYTGPYDMGGAGGGGGGGGPTTDAPKTEVHFHGTSPQGVLQYFQDRGLLPRTLFK